MVSNTSRQLCFPRLSRMGCHAIACVLIVVVSGCAAPTHNVEGPARKPFNMKSVIKTDIDTVVESHIEIMRGLLQRMMIKLYKRNPRELLKSPVMTIDSNLERLFERTTDWRFPELHNLTGAEAIYLAVDEDFAGDRVFAFMTGLLSMTMASYDYQTEFYLFDNLDPQKLYNCARNIEIAVWKIEHDSDARGDRVLLTNSRPDEIKNLSYERLFGKLIATQDNMATVIADKQNRVIRRVIQNMATAVFLPI